MCGVVAMTVDLALVEPLWTCELSFLTMAFMKLETLSRSSARGSSVECLAPLGLDATSMGETVRSVLLLLSPPSSFRSRVLRSASSARWRLRWLQLWSYN